jgi:hypothetical protein
MLIHVETKVSQYDSTTNIQVRLHNLRLDCSAQNHYRNSSSQYETRYISSNLFGPGCLEYPVWRSRLPQISR